MSQEKIILCPGQGAQAVGMGRKWFDASEEARAILERADVHLGGRLGAPLSTICFDGPPDRLNQTDVSQPAIYVVGVACWHALMARWGAAGPREAGVVATAGLSLGEYTALHLAGSFSFEDGLELVTLRGRAMQDAAEATPSGMVALIGADEAKAEEVCAHARQGDVLVCANFNAPGQVVVSGTRGACERAIQVAGQFGLRATSLPVAGAFHSPLMEPAADRLRNALAEIEILEPGCPVTSNVTGRRHEAIPGRTIADSIRERLVEQLTSPVRWADGCTWLIESFQASLHELAPGKTLAGLMRRIERTTKVEAHDEPSS